MNKLTGVKLGRHPNLQACSLAGVPYLYSCNLFESLSIKFSILANQTNLFSFLFYSNIWYQSFTLTIDGGAKWQRRDVWVKLPNADKDELYRLGDEDESFYAGPWSMGSNRTKGS